MLLNRSTTPRDSTTDIEKTSQKDAPERERPNKSVVKIVTAANIHIFFIVIEQPFCL